MSTLSNYLNNVSGPQNLATGTAIASAATVNLDTATGNRVHITGTTAITSITLTRGPRTVIFDGILTLTHNATTNNLPGAANITTAVGDRAIYESDGTTVYCVSYIKASGYAVIGSVGDHEVFVSTATLQGTTNVYVRRFTTIVKNVGTAITYADSATLGASFTVNEPGLYVMSYYDANSTGASITVFIASNSVAQTPPIANQLAIGLVNSSIAITITRTVRLSAGDIVRPISSTPSTFTDGNFKIIKIGL